MLIRVMYLDGTFDMVKPEVLNKLITSKRIKKFYRSGDWVDVETGPLREVARSYGGSDRRGIIRIDSS